MLHVKNQKQINYTSNYITYEWNKFQDKACQSGLKKQFYTVYTIIYPE
jgi:hypothetical protein